MEKSSLTSVFQTLLNNWENETVEFKEASEDYKSSEIFKYFSALANEANLRGINRGWLIFGVNNKTRQVVGTKFRTNSEKLQGLKEQVKQSTGSFTFTDIHEITVDEKRIIMFEIPPAPRGIPVFANGHAYSRAGESLKALDLVQLDKIRNQALAEDWSAQPVEDAKISDLDDDALKKARKDFIHKQQNNISAQEISDWSDMVFLEKIRLVRNGNLTRAAILLFGKNSSWHFLSPHPAQLTWKLRGEESAYQHFGLPFYLSSSELFSKIRNVQLRILPNRSLIPLEISKYNRNVVMEGLHNAIIHQDYTKFSRIIVTEYVDRLEILSAGGFYEGEPIDYVEGTKTPQRYRNACLAQAMTELNLIDAMGQGISRIFKTQAERYFPLPDYDLKDENVKLTIYGRIVDLAYTRLLIEKTDLPISEILALDRVQKRLSISDKIAKQLRKKQLIEGRKPHLYISSSIARVSSTNQNSHEKKTDTTNYSETIITFLRKQGVSTRADIQNHIYPFFDSSLSDKEKSEKLSNIVTKLRRKNLIQNIGSRSRPKWIALSPKN